MDKTDLGRAGELALVQRRFDCSVYALHANPRMKARAPILVQTLAGIRPTAVSDAC
jgi:hypothetical protein